MRASTTSADMLKHRKQRGKVSWSWSKCLRFEFEFVRMEINACKLAYAKTPFTIRKLAASPTGESISISKGELSIWAREEATSEKMERRSSLGLLGPESCPIIGLSTISDDRQTGRAGAMVGRRRCLRIRRGLCGKRDNL